VCSLDIISLIDDLGSRWKRMLVDSRVDVIMVIVDLLVSS